MDNDNIVNEGQQICDDLTRENKGDHLTTLVVAEIGPITSDMSTLDGDIAGVQAAVEAKRAELAEQERKKREAEAKRKAQLANLKRKEDKMFK